MVKILDNNIVVITGGSSGIGYATVKKVIEYGGIPVILDKETPELSDGDNYEYIRTDISNEEEVKEAFKQIEERLGLTYGLVNNAAISPKPSPSEDISDEILKKTFSINVFGTFYCNKYAIMQMLKLGKGSIVNISSVIGKVGSKNTSIYAASKSALIGMTKSDAITYSSKNIRFNALLPGFVDTPLIKSNARNSGNPELYYENLKLLHPIGRLAKAEEIAEMIVFLISERSSFITGSEIVIDGGYTSI
jgi:NAD(P)-dependent dehydrogenase (short-subunit alcohol dehydrogenase family)